MLSAEKDTLSSAVRQREAELQEAQSLVREKEAALSQEQQRSAQERDELQGQLAHKVAALPASAAEVTNHRGASQGCEVVSFWNILTPTDSPSPKST